MINIESSSGEERTIPRGTNKCNRSTFSPLNETPSFIDFISRRLIKPNYIIFLGGNLWSCRETPRFSRSEIAVAFIFPHISEELRSDLEGMFSGGGGGARCVRIKGFDGSFDS